MRTPITTAVAAIAAAGAMITLGASPALAAGPARARAARPADVKITATYAVNGSTYLNSIQTTVSLGPGKLASTLNLNTNAVTATLTLPPATASFNEFGFIPVTATAEFIQVGAATGKASLTKNTVSVTSHDTMRITSLVVAGLPIPVGQNCQTRTPATVSVTSQPGFKVLKGGKLAGTYTLPRFSHCGLATLLINLTIPGPNNTLTLTLSNPKFGS
jgi:hypothetical protein